MGATPKGFWGLCNERSGSLNLPDRFHGTYRASIVFSVVAIGDIKIYRTTRERLRSLPFYQISIQSGSAKEVILRGEIVQQTPSGKFLFHLPRPRDRPVDRYSKTILEASARRRASKQAEPPLGRPLGLPLRFSACQKVTRARLLPRCFGGFERNERRCDRERLSPARSLAVFGFWFSCCFLAVCNKFFGCRDKSIQNRP